MTGPPRTAAASYFDEVSRYVYVQRPRCPNCGGVQHHAIRSTDQGDGTRMKRTECKECHRKFIIILE